MFPMIAGLLPFLGRAGAETLLFTLIDLLARRGGRKAVGQLAARAVGKAPQLTSGTIGRLGRSAKLGAGFGLIGAGLHSLSSSDPNPGAMAEIQRANSFLLPANPAVDQGPDINQLLALLAQLPQNGQQAPMFR